MRGAMRRVPGRSSLTALVRSHFPDRAKSPVNSCALLLCYLAGYSETQLLSPTRDRGIPPSILRLLTASHALFRREILGPRTPADRMATRLRSPRRA